MKKMIKLAKSFSKKIKQVVAGLKEAVQMFKDLVKGRISIKDYIDELVSAISDLPNKVCRICREMTQVLNYTCDKLTVRFVGTNSYYHSDLAATCGTNR